MTVLTIQPPIMTDLPNSYARHKIEFMGFTEDEISHKANITQIDYCLQDLCKMDLIKDFTGLIHLCLVNCGLSSIEVCHHTGLGQHGDP